jgi:hypothetical protein
VPGHTNLWDPDKSAWTKDSQAIKEFSTELHKTRESYWFKIRRSRSDAEPVSMVSAKSCLTWFSEYSLAAWLKVLRAWSAGNKGGSSDGRKIWKA